MIHPVFCPAQKDFPERIDVEMESVIETKQWPCKQMEQKAPVVVI